MQLQVLCDGSQQVIRRYITSPAQLQKQNFQDHEQILSLARKYNFLEARTNVESARAAQSPSQGSRTSLSSRLFSVLAFCQRECLRQD